MKKALKGLYLTLIVLFLYLPIGTLMVLSFNSGKTMNGRNVYRMPINTAKSPYMKDTGRSVTPSHTSNVLMSPLALRIRMSA